MTGKKVCLITAAGDRVSEADWAAFDVPTGYVRHLLGIIGQTDVGVVSV